MNVGTSLQSLPNQLKTNYLSLLDKSAASQTKQYNCTNAINLDLSVQDSTHLSTYKKIQLMQTFENSKQFGKENLHDTKIYKME